MSSESEDDDPPFITTTLQDEDSMPLTSLIWGEETLTTNNDDETSTSRQQEQDESDHDDINRGWITQNIACLIARDQSTDSHEYEWEILSDASCELGLDFIHAYATQPNVVEESSIGSDKFGLQNALVDHVGPSRFVPNLDSFVMFTIGSTSHVTGDDSFHIKNLEASTSLSLIHLDLID